MPNMWVKHFCYKDKKYSFYIPPFQSLSNGLLDTRRPYFLMKKILGLVAVLNVCVATSPAIAQESRASQCAEYGAYSDADGIWHNCDEAEETMQENSDDDQALDETGDEPEYEMQEQE